MPDYNSLINEQLKSNQSLSDRIAWIERMNTDLAGKAVDANQGQARAPLEHPFNMAKTSLGIGTQGLMYGQSQRENLLAGQKALAELLGFDLEERKLAETERSNKTNEGLDLLKLGSSAGNLTIGPDGKLKATGEIDDVDANLQAVYNGTIKLKDLTPSDRGKITARAQRLGIELPSEESQARKSIETYLQQMKGLYYGASGTEDDLSMGFSKGTKTNILNVFGGKYNPTARTYMDARKGTVRKVMDFVGEKGIMTDVDAKRLMSLMPDTTLSPEAAAEKWAFIEKALDWKFSQANPRDALLPTTEAEMGGISSGLDSEDEALINKYRK